MVKPHLRHSFADYLKSTYAIAERRTCRLVMLSRSVYQYRSHRDPQTALRQRMCEIAATCVRYGYRKIRVLLQREEAWSLRYRPSRKRRAQMSRPARVGDHSGKSRVQSGLRCGPAGRRSAISCADYRRCLHARSAGNRRWSAAGSVGCLAGAGGTAPQARNTACAVVQ
jgi:putative transposase